MLKRLALLALLTLSLASAKTFKFNLAEVARAGDVQLKPGEYRLQVDGDKAVLMDKDGGSINVSAKVEAAEYELSFTAVCLSRADGTTRIQAIYLDNRRSRVVFQ